MDPTVQGSLNLRPDQSQFFTGVRLTLRCDYTHWKVWRKTQGTVMRCGDGDHDQKWGMYSGSWCTVKYLEVRDSGQYWCQSEEGEMSESVTLSVADRGVILQMPVLPVYAGQTVRLICEHRTVSATNAIFYKNNQLLSEENTSGIRMTFQQVAVSNEGQYHCEIKGEKSQPSQLRVKAPTTAPPISLSSTNVPLTTATTEHSLPSWLFPVLASVVGVVLLIVLVLLVLLVKRCRCKKGKGKRRGKRRKGRAPPPPGHHTTGRCPHRTPKAPTQK